MDSSYLTLISFVILTIIYFAFPSVGKLKVTTQMLTEQQDNFSQWYILQNLPRLFVYFLFVIFFQFFFNSIFVISSLYIESSHLSRISIIDSRSLIIADVIGYD